MTSGCCGGGGGKTVLTAVQQYVLPPSSSSSRRRCIIISCSCESLVCGFSAVALLSSAAAPRPTTAVVPREISVPESAEEQLEALELSLLLWLLLLLEEEEEEAMEEAEVSA